jgi:hypothetical protein
MDVIPATYCSADGLSGHSTWPWQAAYRTCCGFKHTGQASSTPVLTDGASGSRPAPWQRGQKGRSRGDGGGVKLIPAVYRAVEIEDWRASVSHLGSHGSPEGEQHQAALAVTRPAVEAQGREAGACVAARVQGPARLAASRSDEGQRRLRGMTITTMSTQASSRCSGAAVAGSQRQAPGGASPVAKARSVECPVHIHISYQIPECRVKLLAFAGSAMTRIFRALPSPQLDLMVRPTAASLI